MNVTYSFWICIGFAALICGVYLVGGIGIALITFGCGLIAAGIFGLRNNAEHNS